MNNPLRTFMGDSGPQDGVYSREALAALLRNERGRADRDGSAFSLIVFEVGTRKEADLSRVVELLRQRARSIDAVGWLDEGCLALLLPTTPPEGAWKLAVELEAGLMERIEPPPFTVYSYPRFWYETWERPVEPGASPDGAEPPGSAPTSAGRREPDSVPGRPAAPEEPVLRLESRVRSRVGSLLVRPIPGWKRAMDVTFSLVLLVLLSPLFLLITLAVWVASPGPVLFRQARVGYRGEPFGFLKFRTMKVGSASGTHQSHLVDLIRSDRPMAKLDQGRDDRVIPGGRFLRRTSLDELPQLFNVLRGEMSLVGPRPCIPYEAREYQRWHTERFDILPGMTGLWQVSGKNRLTFRQMVRLDIAYGRRLSPWRDLGILLRTVPTLLQLAFERASPQEMHPEGNEAQPSVCEFLSTVAERFPIGGEES